MFFYAHSINELSSLNQIDLDTGVEIDIRDEGGKLVLGHDPMQKSYTNISEFLDSLKGRNVIANIKSERVEKEFINLINLLSPKSEYFFLDSSFSMIANFGNKYNFASRFSEFESIETSIALIKANLIKWIWVDTFFNFPINEENVKVFNSLQVAKCLTSPDLLGRPEDIKKYSYLIKKHCVCFDAICCKKENISKWNKYLNS